MLVPIRPLASSSSIRLLHCSPRACNLIAPPDSVSHMRPIIYSDAPVSITQPLTSHPYSLTEFTPEPQDQGRRLDLQFRLQRQQLDNFHHSFWFDSNSRFEAAKQAVLAGLPSSSTSVDKEKTLSEFYRQWYLQELNCTKEYTAEWRRRNIDLLKLGVRVEYENFTKRLVDILSFKKSTP